MLSAALIYIYIIVNRWDNSQASWFFTPLSNQTCFRRCYYICSGYGLLMQISLADYSAYLYEITYTYIRSVLVFIDRFQGDF